MIETKQLTFRSSQWRAYTPSLYWKSNVRLSSGKIYNVVPMCLIEIWFRYNLLKLSLFITGRLVLDQRVLEGEMLAYLCLFLFLVALGFEPRASHMLNEDFTTELHSLCSTSAQLVTLQSSLHFADTMCLFTSMGLTSYPKTIHCSFPDNLGSYGENQQSQSLQ